MPGFTGHSLVPKAAAKIGIPFDELVERIVFLAFGAIGMSRRAAKKRPHIVRKSHKSRLSWNLSPAAWRRLVVGTLWVGALATVIWGAGRLDAHVASLSASDTRPHVVWDELPV